MRLRRFWMAGALLCPILTAPVLAGEIHDAITRGDSAMVVEMLRGNPQIVGEQDTNRSRDYPLHTAAYTGQLAIAKLLLSAGADLECKDADGSTPLHDAALFRRREMVGFLLSRGADVKRRDTNGAYALSFAASGGDSAVVRWVLDAGADLDLQDPRAGNTLMHFACSRGLFWFADILKAHGHDINEKNGSGETPLHWVCLGRFPQRVEPTLARGANPAAVDTSGNTPLMTACFGNPQPETIRALLAHGADPNTADRGGNTPLFGAAGRGCADCVRQLLQSGGKADVTNRGGSTPLTWAVDQGQAEVVTLLLGAGAKPTDVDPDLGWTLLHKAAALGYRDIAGALMDHETALEVKDKQGQTPLQLAERYGQTALAGDMKSRGAKAGPARTTADPARPGKVGPDEAEIWYLGHSGWAIKTAGHFLIFDYGNMGRRSDEASLASGDINPAEIAGEHITVFASHEHGDHFMPAIFDWIAQAPQTTYVCGFRPRNLQNNPAYEYIEPHQSRTIDGMKVTAITANDSGEGFAVEVDGLTIFHPGDHTRRTMDGSDGFQPEIDFLVAQGVRPDIAFIPLSGCGMTDQTPVRLGTEYILDNMKPKTILPMHGGLFGMRYVNFVRDIQDKYPQTSMVGALCKGDHFRYKNGKAG